MVFSLPHGFSLGVASAATQIDGDCKNSNWYDWFKKGHIKDGSNPDIATRHIDYTHEDAELMASMSIGDYRLGLEWSRLEPAEGEFCDKEFERVRKELILLRQKGIRPLVTLHHFSNPLWFESKGAFLCKDYESIFRRYVRECIVRLGDLVDEYITINEPNVYAQKGYFEGEWPPGKRSIIKTLKVIARMGVCHRKAYLDIHKLRRELGLANTKVGFAHHMRPFEPKNPKNPWHRLCSRLVEYLFEGYITKTYTIGPRRYHGVYSDFHAINYYSRTAVSGLCDGRFNDVPCNDLGWEIYPRGITVCANKLLSILKMPIYITENGTCDNTDAFRSRFICDHLKEIANSGLPIERYYHWCFVDNFEWVEGMSARFGLVSLNPSTMERTIKRSGQFYSQIIKNHGVTQAMHDEFCQGKYNYR